MSNILITGSLARCCLKLKLAKEVKLEKQGHLIIDYNLEDGNDVRTQSKDLIMGKTLMC